MTDARTDTGHHAMTDATTPRTLHARVAEEIVGRIRDGQWPVGSTLPSEHELSALFGVSRHTLRHALKTVAGRGLVELRQGAASKVISATEPRVYSQDFNTLREVLRYPANTVRENVLEQYVECDAALQPVLRSPLGSSWYRIGAVRRDEGSGLPMAWTDIYILGRFARVTKLKNHQREMVYEQIERHFGVSIERAEIEIDAGTFSREQAQQLKVPAGSPALVIVRRYFDAAGDPFEVSVTRHVPGRFTFTMALHSLTARAAT